MVSRWSAATDRGRPNDKPDARAWELYDIDADRTEMHDLADEMPDRVNEMGAMWDVWAARVGVIEWRSWDGGDVRSS